MKHLWTVHDLRGTWLMNVFAEEYRPEPQQADSFGSHVGHFWIGNTVVATVDRSRNIVRDSGGAPKEPAT